MAYIASHNIDVLRHNISDDGIATSIGTLMVHSLFALDDFALELTDDRDAKRAA